MLKDRGVCAIEKSSAYPLFELLVGSAIDAATIAGQWPLLMA